MKTYKGVDLYIHVFLTSVLVGGEWLASHPGRFTHEEKAPVTHCIVGWVDPRAGLDDVENRKFLTLPALEFRPLGHPVHSQSLYRLRYRSSYLYSVTTEKFLNGNSIIPRPLPSACFLIHYSTPIYHSTP
jgi:hypothetical protein